MHRGWVIAAVTAAMLLANVPLAGAAKLRVLPNLTLTPGSIDPTINQDNLAQTICLATYTVNDDVSRRVRDRVFAAYRIKKKDRRYVVIDHLIPLSLGGSNQRSNLWPEPKSGQDSSAAKDGIEVALYLQVCAGNLPLGNAQQAIARDWRDGQEVATAAAARKAEEIKQLEAYLLALQQAQREAAARRAREAAAAAAAAQAQEEEAARQLAAERERKLALCRNGGVIDSGGRVVCTPTTRPPGFPPPGSFIHGPPVSTSPPLP